MSEPTHPYLTIDQFQDITFLRVRRQVAKLRYPHAELQQEIDQLDQLIDLYDGLIADAVAKRQRLSRR